VQAPAQSSGPVQATKRIEHAMSFVEHEWHVACAKRSGRLWIDIATPSDDLPLSGQNPPLNALADHTTQRIGGRQKRGPPKDTAGHRQSLSGRSADEIVRCCLAFPVLLQRASEGVKAARRP
jgi:hypothetical protein